MYRVSLYVIDKFAKHTYDKVVFCDVLRNV